MKALLAELADASGLRPDDFGHTGSTPVEGTKYCSSCNKYKLIKEFSFKIKSKNLRQVECKECKKEYHDNYYLNNKSVYAKAKQRGKERGYNGSKLLNDFVNSFKVNGCVLCSEKYYAALDFHHINPNEKEDSIARLTSKKSVEIEVAKCVVLCSNCHRKFHYGHEETVKALKLYCLKVSVRI